MCSRLPAELLAARILLMASSTFSNVEELMNNCHALSTGSLAYATRAKPEIAPTPALDQPERLERAVLRDLVEQLQSRERLRAEWTAMAVHELRRPLTTIDLATQLLQDGSPAEDEAMRARLEHIRWGIQQLSRVTEDLFDASCIEARRMRIARVPVPIARVVHDAIAHLPDLAPRCSLRVEPGADVQVSADPGRVEQVLGNLLENAAKYGDPGAKIEIDVARHEDGVRVTVSSRGPGIPADRLSSVFDRFERGPQARAERPGLGLGLYIAKGLIEAHGGRIWVRSAPAVITQFHFTLPLASSP
jgi:signal transduction histidine kinase